MTDLVRHASFTSFFDLPTPYLSLKQDAETISTIKQESKVYREPWVARFDKHLSDWGEEGPCEIALAGILKDAFLSVDHSTAVKTAQRLRSFYENKYVHWDFFGKDPDDKGMRYFHGCFNDVAFVLAMLLPYNSSAQEQLVQLIFELRQVPAKQFKVWGENYLVWTQNADFWIMMDSSWNAEYPNEKVFRGTKLQFREKCDDWVNYSSFIARCIEAGLDKDDENCFKYPRDDITIGLEHEMPPRLARDCKVMVAAQYILLAGRALAQEFMDPSYKNYGIARWRRRAEKLREISKEDGNPRLAYAAKEARRHMISLHPGFYQPVL